VAAGTGCLYSAVEISSPSLQRLPPSSTRDPVAIAACVVWATIVAGPLLALVAGAPWSARALIGLGAQAAFLALFVVRGLTLGDRISLTAQRALALGTILAALVACWAFPDGVQPTLLVLAVPMLPALFPWPVVMALLAAANLVLAWLLFASEPLLAASALLPMQLFVAYVAFQAFVLLAIVSLRQANDARDAARRINAELMATRQLLAEGVRAEERLRLSRELHDVAGHKLTALKMQLALQRQARDSPQLVDSERLADELLSDIRAVVGTLRQHEGVELAEALRALDRPLPGPGVHFDLDAEARVADMRAAEALLRCAQEGLTNALRHAGATRIAVRLARTPGGVQLDVEDDGAVRAAELRPGHGLRGLRERLRELGGSVDWEDRQPRGLRLRARLPEP
jgi:signal transduction histidine kinase